MDNDYSRDMLLVSLHLLTRVGLKQKDLQLPSILSPSTCLSICHPSHIGSTRPISTVQIQSPHARLVRPLTPPSADKYPSASLHFSTELLCREARFFTLFLQYRRTVLSCEVSHELTRPALG